jgi:hypothetical protein
LEYAARFEQAKHRVLVHNRNVDDVFFVQKFLDGLKYNISNAIALHKPRTVDVALSLALMQEGMLEASRRFSSRTKEGSRFSSRSVIAHAPVGVLGTPPADQTVSEKRTGKPRWDDKLAALRSARRAKGLYMKCGEPYSPQHRCHKQVPLHVLEEILELAQVENSAEAKSTTSGSDTEEELLPLSYNAAEGTQGKKTMRLQGLIQDKEILILVDSGSSSTFISTTLVQQLQLQTTPIPATKVTIADGSLMTCDSQIPRLQWWVQGHTFQSDARVLSL